MAASKSRTTPKGWTVMGSHGQSYQMDLCKETCHSGSQCGHIKSIDPCIDGFGTLGQGIDADQFLGHAIKLSGWVKSSNVEEWAGVWMRVDSGSSVVAFDNMQDRPIVGNTDWTRYELTLNVPEQSTKILFGVLLSGVGELWMDDFILEQVESLDCGPSGDPNRSCGVRYQEKAAVNLDFSQGLRRKTSDCCLSGVPVGWFKQDHGQYPCKVGVEKARSSGEPTAAFIQSEYVDGNGALLQSVGTGGFAGKRLKLTAMVKTAGVQGEAALFYRSDVDRILSATHDHMEGRKLVGDNDWEECACVIDVPADSDNIYIGGTLNGAGTVWFADFKMEVVSSKVKTTGQFGAIGKKPKRVVPKYRNGEPTNLDFSLNSYAAGDDGLPQGWIASGSAPRNFEMGLAPDVMLEGRPCAIIKAISQDEENFGTFMQNAGAKKLLGKRVRLSAQLKTERAAWAALWLRFDDANGKVLAFDNMQERALKGTVDWTACECVLDVPDEAVDVSFGVLLSGRGTVWFGNVALDVVGGGVEVTAEDYCGDVGSGVNLDFEE